MPLAHERTPQGSAQPQAQAQQQRQQQPRPVRDVPDKPLFDLRGGVFRWAACWLPSRLGMVDRRTGCCCCLHLHPRHASWAVQHTGVARSPIHRHPMPATTPSGICIGNGLSDPRTQTTVLSKTAVQVGMVSSHKAAEIDDRVAEVGGPGWWQRLAERSPWPCARPGRPGNASRWWPDHHP
jgi:hypothetical protein